MMYYVDINVYIHKYMQMVHTYTYTSMLSGGTVPGPRGLHRDHRSFEIVAPFPWRHLCRVAGKTSMAVMVGLWLDLRGVMVVIYGFYMIGLLWLDYVGSMVVIYGLYMIMLD